MSDPFDRIPSAIAPFCSPSYNCEAAEALEQTLRRMRVFDFEVFPGGLFPAVGSGSATERTSGYRAVWVRDNAHIAYAHLAAGETAAAVENGLALVAFFEGQRHRFEDIISKRRAPSDPMNRPHIRFDGETGAEIDTPWPHAQNDALGVFLWFFCTLVLEGAVDLNASQAALLTDFVRYFEAIEYWQDEDSGHWEEQRKISASSIGAVTAGIGRYRALRNTSRFPFESALSLETVDGLLATGTRALRAVLPSECIQPNPLKRRRYDAALLFLIDPLEIVSGHMAERIIEDITTHLEGAYGISRYLEDSYWGPDYRRIPEEKRTIDLSEDILERREFAVAGKEAQWCLFDAVVSIVHGKRYRESSDPGRLALQMKYLNRALSQLVEAEDAERLLLPEAYFIESDRYVPNDHLPLQWAHANLWRAVNGLTRSLDPAIL